MRNSGKSLLILSFYVLLGTLVFYPALKIGFLGDFAGDIYGCQDNWLNFAAYQWNFYVPAMAIYYGLYKMFHLFPLPYHAFHLFWIFINAWLVYTLAQRLKFASWQCWIAGLLALFNSAAFDAYFWLSTMPKVLATSCGLTALIFLIRFREDRSSMWGWGYLMMVTIGITLESTALILPLLGLLLDVYYRPRWVSGQGKASIIAGLRLHLWSFSITAIFLLIRHFLGIRPYVENLPLIKKFQTFARTIVGTFFHGLQDHLWLKIKSVSLDSEILILLLLVILILAFRFKQGLDRKRFSILLLLWMGACLPHVIGANFLPRYLYFPGVFAALVVVDVLGSVRLHFYGRNCTWLLIFPVLIGYFCLDLYAFHRTLNSYLKASRIYDAGIQIIRTHLAEMPPGTRLVLVDFPDYIKETYQDGRKKYSVLVYRNALPFHLILLYPSKNFTVSLIKLSPPTEANPNPLGTPANPEQLAKLLTSPQTLMCRYHPGSPGNFIIASGAERPDLSILK